MNNKIYFLILFFLFFIKGNSYAIHGDSLKINSESSTITSKTDSNKTEKKIELHSLIDSVKSNKKLDSTAKHETTNGFDTTVYYYAKDTVHLRVKAKDMSLHGQSHFTFKTQKLEADKIIINFDKSILTATGKLDSAKKLKGFPIFTDNGEKYVGENIKYNYKTKQGIISLGETEMDKGYYYGSKIRKVSDKEMFIQDGCYTTCDDAHPHFYFGSPKMKVISQDRIFLDPLILYVEDMPVFMLPVGLFFPNKSGRQSGILIPSYYFSNNRGVVINKLGYYFALSDYYDTQFKGDIYTKGGFVLYNETRWSLRNTLNGSMDLSFGRTRTSPDEDFLKNWNVKLNHNQTLTPQSSIVANINYSSQDYFRNVSFNINDRQTQEISSNASYQRSFDNGSNFSVSLQRSQNIITNEVNNQTFPNVTYSLPSMNPFKNLVSKHDWVPKFLKDVSFSYNVSGLYNYSKLLNYTSRYDAIKDTTVIDTTFKTTYQSYISHNPSISISPKVGYINITPSIGISARNYFRRMSRSYDIADSTTKDTYEYGFYTEYNYSLNLNFNTRLFGVIRPNLWGITAARHIFQPEIGFSYRPDFSTDNYGFIGSYYNSATKSTVKYSHYESDGGSVSNGLSKNITYSLKNTFEMKLAKGDTTQDLNVQLLQWNINGSYDMAKDSLRFSDIQMSFRSPDFKLFSLNATANFTPYDQEKIWDATADTLTNTYRSINKLLIDAHKGIMRLTSITLYLSTRFSSQGVSLGTSFSQDSKPPTADSSKKVELGERFNKRIENNQEQHDLYGDNSPGYTPFNIPWDASFDLSYSYSNVLINQFSRQLNLRTSFNFTITPTLKATGSLQYDFINKQLLSPVITLTKDLHCWNMLLTWTPTGYNQGFYLKFAINAQMLQDLKLEKQKSALVY